MKWIIPCIACIFFILAACNSSKKISSAKQLDGNWELTFFAGGGKDFVEMFGQRRPRLQFNIDSSRVAGNTGCNSIAGGITIAKNTLRFADNMVMTKMACPGYDEQIFVDALTRVNRYEMPAGQLNLYNDSTLLMSFSKR